MRVYIVKVKNNNMYLTLFKAIKYIKLLKSFKNIKNKINFSIHFYYY